MPSAQMIKNVVNDLKLILLEPNSLSLSYVNFFYTIKQEYIKSVIMDSLFILFCVLTVSECKKKCCSFYLKAPMEDKRHCCKQTFNENRINI